MLTTTEHSVVKDAYVVSCSGLVKEHFSLKYG